MPTEVDRARRFRVPLIWLSAGRMVVSVAAFPLAPFLYRHHYLVLVLLRPTRLVLFFGGVLVRHHVANAAEIVAAAIPLGLFGVWQAYALGLANEREIARGRIPGPWKRFLPATRIRTLQKALRRQGVKLIILARIGTFPSYLIGTAAGSSDVDPKKFFAADAAGVLAELGGAIGLGYAAGNGGAEAWIVGAGVAAVVAAGIIFAWQLHRQ